MDWARPKRNGPQRLAIVLAALIALVLPRLITAAPLDLLEGKAALVAGRIEQPGATFPGSAFFFAEGAFDPVPGIETKGGSQILSLEEVKAAPAAIFRGLTPLDSYRALNCLTSAVYYEAGNESEDGQRAVAQVVLNRVLSHNWPNSVCGVVYEGADRPGQPCQFSFSCDGAMTRMPVAARWAQARRIAQEALAGKVYPPVGLATYYHTLAVRPPWSATMKPVAVIGAHIFYRSPGADGTPAAFATAYTGRELISGPRLTPARQESGRILPYRATVAEMTPPPPPVAKETMKWTETPKTDAADTLPESTIRPEFRNTGKPIG